MSQSLYRIQQDLEQLAALRESAELEGDSEALKVIDQQIAEYLTKEAAKVTSYVGLIRSRESTVAGCDAEIARLQSIRRAAAGDIDRLKSTALEVMNRFGVRELKATPGGGLRIQLAGGLRKMVIDVPSIIPERLLKLVTVPDNSAIRAALENGESVPGCRLEQRKDTLRVL